MRAAGLAACASLAALLAGCGSSSTGPSPTPSPSATGANPAPPPGGAGFTYNGITHVSWWHDGYGAPAGTESRRALAATGASWAGLLVTWYMDTKSSSTIAPNVDSTPEDDVVRRAIDELHAVGLQVMLKPHVDVRDGTWRGQITPGDPGQWFVSYAAFMDHYTAIAAEQKVGMLCVGTELATMSGSRYAAQWSDVIARVRRRYSGLLTYAANGVTAADEFTSVSFWTQVDLIGADAYTPLTNKTNPTRQELAAGWHRNRDGVDMVAAFHNVQQAYGKPFIFAEVGYRSADGTARAPWDWSASAPADTIEQADCYSALYQVWSGESAWMKGPFWWAWDVDPPGAGDTGYNPRGKPAEDVLRGWQR